MSLNSDGAIKARPPWRGLALLLLGGFVTIFDLFVVNIAIASIREELAASLSEIGWIVAGYELAFGAMLITGGRLGDRFGRRRLFLTGMAGFAAASALCGVAPTVEVLIAARILQGIAAALLFPQIYASIRVGFPGRHGGRAFGWLGMTLGLAAIAGQVLGGWLVEADLWGLGWRVIFLVNVPIGLATLMAGQAIPETFSGDQPVLDPSGVVLAGSGLTLLLLPLLEAPSRGWAVWSTAALAGGVLLLGLFWHQQSRRAMPLVDTRLLREPDFAAGGLLVLLIFSTASSFFLCFALLLQTGLGLTPFAAGSVLVPCSIAFIAASLGAPQLVARLGDRAIAYAAGMYALGFAALVAQVWLAGGGLVAAHLVPALIVIGAAQGVINTQSLNLVLGGVNPAQAGMASGIVSTLQQVGAALGVAAVGILFALTLETTSGPPGERYAAAFAAAMLYNLTAAFAIALLLGRMTGALPPLVRRHRPCPE